MVETLANRNLALLPAIVDLEWSCETTLSPALLPMHSTLTKVDLKGEADDGVGLRRILEICPKIENLYLGTG